MELGEDPQQLLSGGHVLNAMLACSEDRVDTGSIKLNSLEGKGWLESRGEC